MPHQRFWKYIALQEGIHDTVFQKLEVVIVSESLMQVALSGTSRLHHLQQGALQADSSSLFFRLSRS